MKGNRNERGWECVQGAGGGGNGQGIQFGGIGQWEGMGSGARGKSGGTERREENAEKGKELERREVHTVK